MESKVRKYGGMRGLWSVVKQAKPNEETTAREGMRRSVCECVRA